MHPCLDPILHFIEEGSKTDSIDDKIKYVDPIFDLYYYSSINDIGDEDPLLHYVVSGHTSKLRFNRK